MTHKEKAGEEKYVAGKSTIQLPPLHSHAGILHTPWVVYGARAGLHAKNRLKKNKNSFALQVSRHYPRALSLSLSGPRGVERMVDRGLLFPDLGAFVSFFCSFVFHVHFRVPHGGGKACLSCLGTRTTCGLR